MARDPSRVGCAAESLDRGEPLFATASRVRRWLIVEQPGPWGREALIESRLDHGIAQTVRSRARRAGVRVVLARRPGWDASGSRRVYLVRSDRSHQWIEQLDLEEPRQLLDIDLSLLAADEAPSIGAPGPASVSLVCTNGRHDPCCADFGRPVVRALHDAGVPEVWECSHVGGDRFAANVVCLPSGVYYGRVKPESAASLVRDHDNGLLSLEHYRGRSCYAPMTQAADIFARRELDERRLDGLQLRSAARDGDDVNVVIFEHAHARLIKVRVARELGEAEHLTCSDQGTSQPWRYRLLDLQPVDSAQ
jgi:hypothetical protein